MHTSPCFVPYVEIKDLTILLVIVSQTTQEDVFVYYLQFVVYFCCFCACATNTFSKPQMVKQSLWMGGSECSSRPDLALLWAVAGTQHRLKC